MFDFLRSRETYRVRGPAHRDSIKARRLALQLETLRLKEETIQAKRETIRATLAMSRTPAESQGPEPISGVAKIGDSAGRKTGGRRSGDGEVTRDTSMGRLIERRADGCWYVEGDPDGLGYATLGDAQIAAQFMRRVA